MILGLCNTGHDSLSPYRGGLLHLLGLTPTLGVTPLRRAIPQQIFVSNLNFTPVTQTPDLVNSNHSEQHTTHGIYRWRLSAVVVPRLQTE